MGNILQNFKNIKSRLRQNSEPDGIDLSLLIILSKESPETEQSLDFYTFTRHQNMIFFFFGQNDAGSNFKRAQGAYVL